MLTEVYASSGDEGRGDEAQQPRRGEVFGFDDDDDDDDEAFIMQIMNEGTEEGRYDDDDWLL